MAQLLSRPWILKGEGPNAYLLRLAESNGLVINDLKHLGVMIHADILTAHNCLGPDQTAGETQRYLGHLQNAVEKQPAIWINQSCRFCPGCLAEHAIWSVAWELLFIDACAKHGCWLVDRCDKCGETLRWSRQELLRCDCGALLRSQPCEDAPDSVVGLSRTLSEKFMNATPVNQTDLLIGPNFEQTTRLVRFLGAYGDPNPPRKPQKIRDLGAMDVSWQVTSIAAEVLTNWPINFNKMLHGIMARHAADGGNRFPTRFGFFYATIFRRFSEPAFGFMRDAFEDFVVEHWRGALAKRNTRLSEAILARASWIPANHARARLGVSRSRLNELVMCGKLLGEERLSDKGRRYLVVNQNSLNGLLPAMNDQMDLVAASMLLGLTKSRLRSVISVLFPDARKVEGDTNHWAISRTAIEAFLQRCSAPIADSVDTAQVCLDHIMRFWACSETEIATLLAALRDGAITPVACLRQNKGVSHLVFNEQEARGQVIQLRPSGHAEWTVPQVADMLAIKQEVAYFLVRNGLLASHERVIGRRMTALISRAAIDAFQARFVFARDLAKRRKTSPRALQSQLAELGIHPATAHMVPPCRQASYEWTTELRQIFPATLG